MVMRARELKKVLGDFFLNFTNRTDKIEEQYYQLIKIPNLIILDLGYENDINLVCYYLDHLVEMLSERQNNNKRTIVITNINLEEIIKNISEHPKYIKNRLNQKKIKFLDNLFHDLFIG